jgi:hypothetical protein
LTFASFNFVFKFIEETLLFFLFGFDYLYDFTHFMTDWIIINLRLSFPTRVICSSDTVIMICIMKTQMNSWYRTNWLMEYITITWVVNLMYKQIKTKNFSQRTNFSLTSPSVILTHFKNIIVKRL